MTFLHGYLLAGLALAGVPILVHLIMRQKPRQLPFPAFRFLRQRHLINRRKMRLRGKGVKSLKGHGQGDLYLVLKVMVPEPANGELTTEQGVQVRLEARDQELLRGGARRASLAEFDLALRAARLGHPCRI